MTSAPGFDRPPVPGRTGAAPVRRERGAGGRPRRRDGGDDGDRDRAEHHPAGMAELRAGRIRSGRGPPPWRWTQAGGGATTGPAGGSEALVEAIRGDPERRCAGSAGANATSPARLERGFAASQKLVGRLLRELGYSFQANRKTREGTSHPDRDAQFEHINAAGRGVRRGRAAGRSRWTPRRRSWSATSRTAAGSGGPRASPSRCGCTTSTCPSWARSRPTASTTWPPTQGWVNVGIDHDTAAVRGREHPALVAAAAASRSTRAPRVAGSRPTAAAATACRVPAVEGELQELADETGLAVTVAHFPPGTSKWNKIEHRLFATSRRTGAASRW